MKKNDLDRYISRINDISYDMDSIVKVELNEVKNLLNKGLEKEKIENIICVLEYVEENIFNISQNIKNIK